MLILSAGAATSQAGKNAIHPVGNILDGRLCFGNGYFLTTFTGAYEFPEPPLYAVHDKISRLWLGYSSSPSAQVGLVPSVTEIETGRQWTIGPCDTYRYADGAIIMETKIPVGTVRTETYGLWDKPVFVRRIRFIPNEKATGTYSVSTTMSLFRDYSNKMPDDDPQLLAGYQIVAPDLREWPPSYSFPRKETLKLGEDRRISWHYDDGRYRDVMVTVAEPDAQLGIRNLAAGKNEAAYTGKEAGGVWFRREGKGGELSLTVVLSFDKDPARARALMDECTAPALELKVTQKAWQDWFESKSANCVFNSKSPNSPSVNTAT
jgi:hypothetical protein